MNFERNIDPYKKLRIGNGRAHKILWFSMGAGAELDKEKVIPMIKHWQQTNSIPRGIYPLIERPDGTKQFVETEELIGELIEWNGKYYQLPNYHEL